MAFLDGVNKAIGKAAQGISGAAKGIGDAAQGIGDNLPKIKSSNDSKKDDSGKCPSCGQLLNGITAVCPMCGYELRSVKSSSSISDLTKEIEKLEKKRNVIADSLASKISGRSTNSTDEKIASLIRNFIVPNTKEDIFEFMLLAAGNMDAKLLAGRKTVEGISEIVTKAWESKFEQTYQKAKITFGTDLDFKKIQEVYDKKMQEIDDARPLFSFARRK